MAVSRKTAMRFIVLVGIVSLFADTTYEGGRSANGLYLAVLVFGRLFDRWGIRVLVLGVALSFLFAPLVFLGSGAYAFAGMVLSGLGLGSQEAS